MDSGNKKVAVFLAPGFEDHELVDPVESLRRAGVAVTLIGMSEEDKRGVTGKHGTVVKADISIDKADFHDFDLLVIPGGKGPAQLRKNDGVLAFTRAFDAASKPIAAICHGPQVLASAGLLQDRTATSFFTVAREVKRAGGHYRNKPVVIDGNLITSRQVKDIPVFIEAIFRMLGKDQRDRKTA